MKSWLGKVPKVDSPLLVSSYFISYLSVCYIYFSVIIKRCGAKSQLRGCLQLNQ